jgi:hypothetical protein
MNKVYVLEGHYLYEGFEIISVHTTRELAEAALQGSTSWHNSLQITEHELDPVHPQ